MTPKQMAILLRSRGHHERLPERDGFVKESSKSALTKVVFKPKYWHIFASLNLTTMFGGLRQEQLSHLSPSIIDKDFGKYWF